MLVYGLTIFLGAFLLFQVQPLMGKFVLPWFGGGPGVWTTCLLFFQLVLLAGYAYAHGTSRLLTRRRQIILHLSLLVAALALLPIVPGDTWKPQGLIEPTRQILLLLLATVGVPYFVLSTTGPLLQQWFNRSFPGRSPYRLYALSNAGSLLALLTYPVYFETHFTRRVQATLWAGGLIVYVLGCAWCALRLWRAPAPVAAPLSPLGDAPVKAPRASLPTRLLWLLLPACASLLLLATTNKLCQDVAVVPFLWIVPLALYLLSFIICFDSPRWYRLMPSTLLLAAALVSFCWALAHGSDWPVWKQICVYCGALFVGCLVCHGELYRLRPPPEHLTGFYLAIAAGGAMGGLFVAVVAPLIFTNYYELHWGVFGCGLLYTMVWTLGNPKAETRKPKEDRSSKSEGAAIKEAKESSQAGTFEAGTSSVPMPAEPVSWISRFFELIQSIAASRYFRWSTTIALIAGLILLGRNLRGQARHAAEGAVSSSRNFYGVLSVFEYRKDEPLGHNYLLLHGRITHGFQFVDPVQARWPVSYYGEGSGINLAWNALPSRPRRLGVVGLGTGTLAAFARPGDSVRFYEINPDVRRLATSRFSYLSNCSAKIDIAMGDARLTMENEPPQQFDLLALDAFSSDSIPVHLLTREAFSLYWRHLQTNGVIAVHISNHFLDLEPVVMNLAREFGYQTAIVDCEETDEEWWLYASTWVLLTRNQDLLNSRAIKDAATAPNTKAPRVPLWTDDFASLYQILR